MNVVDWFDPHDEEHLEAWRFLSEHGSWPAGFIPEGVTFTPVWQMGIAWKIAQCWVTLKLN